MTLFLFAFFFQAVCVFYVNKVRLCFNIDVREVKRRTIWLLCVCVCACVLVCVCACVRVCVFGVCVFHMWNETVGWRG